MDFTRIETLCVIPLKEKNQFNKNIYHPYHSDEIGLTSMSINWAVTSAISMLIHEIKPKIIIPQIKINDCPVKNIPEDFLVININNIIAE